MESRAQLNAENEVLNQTNAYLKGQINDEALAKCFARLKGELSPSLKLNLDLGQAWHAKFILQAVKDNRIDLLDSFLELHGAKASTDMMLGLLFTYVAKYNTSPRKYIGVEDRLFDLLNDNKSLQILNIIKKKLAGKDVDWNEYFNSDIIDWNGLFISIAASRVNESAELLKAFLQLTGVEGAEVFRSRLLNSYELGQINDDCFLENLTIAWQYSDSGNLSEEEFARFKEIALDRDNSELADKVEQLVHADKKELTIAYIEVMLLHIEDIIDKYTRGAIPYQVFIQRLNIFSQEIKYLAPDSDWKYCWGSLCDKLIPTLLSQPYNYEYNEVLKVFLEIAGAEGAEAVLSYLIDSYKDRNTNSDEFLRIFTIVRICSDSAKLSEEEFARFKKIASQLNNDKLVKKVEQLVHADKKELLMLHIKGQIEHIFVKYTKGEISNELFIQHLTAFSQEIKDLAPDSDWKYCWGSLCDKLIPTLLSQPYNYEYNEVLKVFLEIAGAEGAEAVLSYLIDSYKDRNTNSDEFLRIFTIVRICSDSGNLSEAQLATFKEIALDRDNSQLAYEVEKIVRADKKELAMRSSIKDIKDQYTEGQISNELLIQHLKNFAQEIKDLDPDSDWKYCWEYLSNELIRTLWSNKHYPESAEALKVFFNGIGAKGCKKVLSNLIDIYKDRNTNGDEFLRIFTIARLYSDSDKLSEEEFARFKEIASELNDDELVKKVEQLIHADKKELAIAHMEFMLLHIEDIIDKYTKAEIEHEVLIKNLKAFSQETKNLDLNLDWESLCDKLMHASLKRYRVLLYYNPMEEQLEIFEFINAHLQKSYLYRDLSPDIIRESDEWDAIYNVLSFAVKKAIKDDKALKVFCSITGAKGYDFAISPMLNEKRSILRFSSVNDMEVSLLKMALEMKEVLEQKGGDWSRFIDDRKEYLASFIATAACTGMLSTLERAHEKLGLEKFVELINVQNSRGETCLQAVRQCFKETEDELNRSKAYGLIQKYKDLREQLLEVEKFILQALLAKEKANSIPGSLDFTGSFMFTSLLNKEQSKDQGR